MLTYRWKIDALPRGFDPQNLHVLTMCDTFQTPQSWENGHAKTANNVAVLVESQSYATE